MQPYFTSNGLVTKALEHAFKLEHIMDLTRLRCLGSLFSMLHQACRNVAQYNANHPDFPMQIEQLERYIQVRGATCPACALSVQEPLRGNVAWTSALLLWELDGKRVASLSTAVSGLCHSLVLVWGQSAENEGRAGRVHQKDHDRALARCTQHPHH